MKGYTVLWLPGYDHAGISTQAVVENRLIKTEGKSRHDYGREEFLKKVFEWKEMCVSYHDQLQASADLEAIKVGLLDKWKDWVPRVIGAGLLSQ